MRKYALALGLTAATGVIGWLDLVTGPAYGLSLFYLGPVAIAAWFVGLPVGLLLAVLGAGLWFASEVITHSTGDWSADVWNGFTRLVIYTGSAAVLARLRADRQRLRELLHGAELAARTDVLTGLANSRAFYERLREETPRLARSRRTVTIAYIDVDNFKRVNDRHGHAKGDEVLAELAAVLRSLVRAGDIPARLGGDEFAIALWDTRTADVRDFEDRLAAALAPVIARYPDTGLGVSIGFAELGPDSQLDDVVRAADEAMYAAKTLRKQRAAASRA